MQMKQLTYRQTITPKPYNSITVEAVVDIESGDNIGDAYNKLRGWVSSRLHKAAEEEAPERPKPLKPEDMY